MYKNKDRQREADKERQRRHRERIGYVRAGYKTASELGVNQSMTKGVTDSRCDKQGVTAQDFEDLPHDVQKMLATVIRSESKPAKRGKDIKCFEDLPVDVQQTIDRMSVVDGKIDQTIKVNRTAIAIHYQHLFPDRYYSTGVA